MSRTLSSGQRGARLVLQRERCHGHNVVANSADTAGPLPVSLWTCNSQHDEGQPCTPWTAVSSTTSELYELWVEDAQDPEWTASIAELRQRLERSTGT